MLKRVLMVAAGAAMLLTLAGPSLAQTAGVVKERQDQMKAYFPTHMRDFIMVMRGESTDLSAMPAKVTAAVAAFRQISVMYPAGSGREANPDTRAKPEVWSQRAAFDAATQKLVVETEKLGELARANNLDGFKAQAAIVGQACGGCHGGPPKSGGQFRFEAP